MSIRKRVYRRWASSVGLLGFLLLAGDRSGLAQGSGRPAGSGLEVGGRVLPLVGATAPPSSVVIEARPAFPNIAARRRAFGGGEPEAIATARTAGDGSFQLSLPEPGCYRVTFKARGFRAFEIPLLPVVEPMRLPPVVPVGLLPLSVSVTNAAGQPVSGSLVRIEAIEPSDASDDPQAWRPAPEWGRTDSQGRVIVDRSAGERVRVIAETVDGLGTAEVEKNAPSSVVRLDPRPSVSIAARLRSGRPAAGALVLSAGRMIAELDAEGTADLRVPGAEEPPLVVVADDGEWAEIAPPPDGASDGAKLSIRLGPPTKARGRAVETITGKGLPALVWVRGEGIAIAGVLRADVQGSFQIPIAGSGRPTFGAASPGHRSLEVRGSVPGPRDLPIILRLDRTADSGDGAGVTGIVLDEAGRPVAGAAIYSIRETVSTSGGETSKSHSERQLATSDIHGGFHAGGLEPGTFDLEARANGFVTGRLTGLRLEAQGRLPDLKFALSRGLRLEGTVRDPQGNPAANVTVEARIDRPIGEAAAIAKLLPPTSSAVSERGGKYVLTGLEPGSYRLTAESPLGRIVVTVEVGSEPLRIDLQLAR